MTSADMSWMTYEIETKMRPKVVGNHMMMPVMMKAIEPQTISQNISFCPALKKAVSGGSGESVSVMYSLIRFIQRESAGVQRITPSQLNACSAKKKTNANPKQRCSKRVMAPPP